MKKILKIWQIFLVIFFLGLGFFILDKYLALDGKLELVYDFSTKPTLISELTPAGRASSRLQNLTTQETYQSLSGDPVYFTVEVPRSYDQVEVTLKYANPEQKIIELGLQKSADWNYELKPIENKFIDDSAWDRLEQENLILLQKNKIYPSVEEFLNNLPLDQRIATYNYQLPYIYKSENYQPASYATVIEPDLRGPHEFYTYLKDEDLDFTFIYQDLNAWFDRDDFKIEIYSGSAQIYSDYAPDDGIEIASGQVSENKEKRVLLTDLPAGLYKISLPVTNDIVLRQIRTSQHLLVAKNHVFLAAQEGENKIYTESDEFLIKTDHPEGLQTISIKGQELVVGEIGKWASWKDEDGILDDFKLLVIPQNDLYFEGPGYYAFSEESYFDPDYLIDALKSDTDIEVYDYLIAANYTPPQEEARYQTAVQTYALDYVPGDRKTLNFLISLPGLEEASGEVIIKEIDLKFTRPNILKKLLK